MRDCFVVSSELDRETADEIAARLAARGLALADRVWLPATPEVRILPAIDAGLVAARFALVLVTEALLARVSSRKDLDGLAARRRVICMLRGVDEAKVARRSRRLAMSAVPERLVDRLDRLVRGAG